MKKCRERPGNSPELTEIVERRLACEADTVGTMNRRLPATAGRGPFGRSGATPPSLNHSYAWNAAHQTGALFFQTTSILQLTSLHANDGICDPSKVLATHGNPHVCNGRSLWANCFRLFLW